MGTGRVDEVAAGLWGVVESELLVALGGGRVIDVAKALAAAGPPRRVAAIPTTLSGAEMTNVHRHVMGVPMSTPRVRPAIVINDPELSASQPVAELAASAANALGHAAEGPLTPMGNPVATLAAREAVSLIDRGFEDPAHPDRDALALGALLAGYVIGSTGYGLHHVVAQTLARFTAVGHGGANAIMLPETLSALARRGGGAVGASGAAELPAPLIPLAAKLRSATGIERLREAGVSEAELERCAHEAAGRAELSLTPPAAEEGELLELYRAAW